MRRSAHQQLGMTLIESLIALLLFSLGILALVGMYSRAIASASDAQYRVEAANLANELLQAVSAGVARDPTGAVLPASLSSFQYLEASTVCGATSGTTTEPPALTGWFTRVRTVRSGLPDSATAGYQHISADTSAAAFNRVVVTLCWQVPNQTAPHSHTVIGYIN